MRCRPLLFAACAAVLGAAPLAAQDTTKAVRPGMAEPEVRARWGDPIIVRRLNDWTYLFYRNGEERRIGWYDTVFLQNGQVMDAIVRSPDHPYLGQSSSPPDRQPVFTPPTQPPQSSAPGAVTGVHVNAPAGSRAPPPGPEA